jgi:hypothetical protein
MRGYMDQAGDNCVQANHVCEWQDGCESNGRMQDKMKQRYACIWPTARQRA